MFRIIRRTEKNGKVVTYEKVSKHQGNKRTNRNHWPFKQQVLYGHIMPGPNGIRFSRAYCQGQAELCLAGHNARTKLKQV